jgi:spore germination cell wall hydrolase CwlJ-like protein
MRSRRAPRKRPSHLRFALAPALFFLGTTQAAYQDLGSLLAKEANIAERARAHLMQGALSSLKTATLSLPTHSFFALPQTPAVSGIDPEVTGSIPRASKVKASIAAAIERSNKKDRFIPLLPTAALPPYDIALSLELESETPDPTALFEFENEPRADRPGSLTHRREIPEGDPTAVFQIGNLLFDSGAENSPPGAFKHRQYVAPAVVPDTSPDAPLHATRKLTPAERLGLNTVTRAKAVKCLSEAIYFEARSEPERGQMAVAQVVINRAFSGYYPNDICGVVYQNKHRHLACQFTFACDGIPDIVTSKPHWALAEKLSNEALDGKGYLQDVGKATHYHAYYVSPYWARKMRKMSRIGAHTFYFPYEWEVNEPTVTAGQ